MTDARYEMYRLGHRRLMSKVDVGRKEEVEDKSIYDKGSMRQVRFATMKIIFDEASEDLGAPRVNTRIVK